MAGFELIRRCEDLDLVSNDLACLTGATELRVSLWNGFPRLGSDAHRALDTRL